MVVGDPRRRETQLGPQIDEKSLHKARSYAALGVERHRAAYTSPIVARKRDGFLIPSLGLRGFYFGPHIFTGVDPGSPLATDLVNEPLLRGADGLVRAPERPGLGVTVNLATVRKYVHSVKIELAAKTIFRQPEP